MRYGDGSLPVVVVVLGQQPFVCDQLRQQRIKGCGVRSFRMANLTDTEIRLNRITALIASLSEVQAERFISLIFA
ncbi:hypothetical protein HMY34_16345 [Thiothrix subterranea]|uniref:hypothetical protein n=1 Tax=Thiothrix subterranea TaxID=2735563 RepID=UPI00192B71BE|nr:hypothetical protein [Thiothrix subterranea]QQZ27262.1 hypothetical protein HMY34_16345 [Thiothrix subterranea]